MKLVGITGKAGSGKTTFSDILAQKSGIGVIHIDDILKDIKLKYFKPLMKQDKQGEKTKVDSRLKTILYSNKILFELFMRFRAKLIQKPLEKEIQGLLDKQKRVIIIDDIFLQYQKCYSELSEIFLMERPFIDRREAVEQRDEISKEEVVAYDVAHQKGNYKSHIKNKHTIKIQKNKSKEELVRIAEEIYQKHFSTMQERYREDNFSKEQETEQKVIQRYYDEKGEIYK